MSERPTPEPPVPPTHDEAPSALRLPDNVEDVTALGRGVMARVEERFRRVSLNVPLRVTLPEPFEVRDLCEGMQEVLERVVEESGEPRVFERATAVDDQLDQRTPQFFLRNIPRLERMVEDRMEFVHAPSERLAVAGLLDEVREARHESPNMLEVRSVKAIVEARDSSALWMKQKDWTRYFGKEVLKDVKGPRWRYDPDRAVVAPDDSEGGEEPAKTEEP